MSKWRSSVEGGLRFITFRSSFRKSEYESYHHFGKALEKFWHLAKVSGWSLTLRQVPCFISSPKCGLDLFNALSFWSFWCRSALTLSQCLLRCFSLERNHVALEFFLGSCLTFPPCKFGRWKTNSQEVKSQNKAENLKKKKKKKKEKKKHLPGFIPQVPCLTLELKHAACLDSERGLVGENRSWR